MKEKLTAILLCIGMLAGMVTPLVADADDTYEDVNKNVLEDENLLEYEDDVWLYIEDGDITLSVNDDGYTSYLQNEAQGICKTAYISNKDKSVSCDRCITINSSATNDIDIVLSDLNISATVALCVNGSGNVNIELDGSNILKSSSRHAGLEVSTGSSIVINDKDNNGSLEAQGKGAGIGSATGNNNGKITINGGTITAVGGFNSAGIGGGDDGGAGLVIINGGEINASSNWYGCGIGSGSYNDEGGTIIINGGKINATGNVHGAGIGGSDGGDVDELIITGGEIISTGKGWMAGVGGGDSKSIVILGGNIKASGGGCDIGFSNGAVHVASVTGRNEDGSFTSVNHIHTYDTIISDEPATLTSPRTISFNCLDENCPKYGEIIYYSFGTVLTEESVTSSISTTFDTSTVTLQEGDTFDFDGIVSTTAEDGLTAIQIDIHKADDDTIGITYTRKTNTDETSPLSGNSFDLSSIPSFQAGDTLTGTTQSITLSADTSWNIYLYAKDADGNTLGGSVIKRIDIVEKEVPFVAGKTYAQTTNTDKFNGFDAPNFTFNEDNTGKFHWVDSEAGESGKDTFTYTISDDTITLTANGLYYLVNVAKEIVLNIVDEKYLKVAEIIDLYDLEVSSIGSTSVGDQFEVGAEQTKPIVSGLQNSYTVTQGDTLNLNFTVTAGNNGKLKVVTVREDGKTTNTYKEIDIFANSHIVNCTIDTNTIGTHTYIVYTYADNYTVTDNVVATFTVTVKAKDSESLQSLIDRVKYVIVCNEHNTNYKYDGSDYNYVSVTIDDNGASAIGIFQWREGRTFDLLDAIVKCVKITQAESEEILGTKLYDDITNGDRDDWIERKLTADEAERVKKLLLTDAGINEQMYLADVNSAQYIEDAEKCNLTQDAAKIVYADARNIGKGYADEIAKSAVTKVGGDGSKVTWELLLEEYASHGKLGSTGYQQRRDRLERLLTEWYGSSTEEPPVVEPDEPVDEIQVVVYDSNGNVIKEGDTLNGEYTVVISNVPSAYQNSVNVELKDTSTGIIYQRPATPKTAYEYVATFDTSMMYESSYSLAAFAWHIQEDSYKSSNYFNFDTDNDAIYGFKLNDEWITDGDTIRLTTEEAKKIKIIPDVKNIYDYIGNCIVHPVEPMCSSSCTVTQAFATVYSAKN